jgi:hypothetical protein
LVRPVDNQRIALDGDVALELAVYRIVLEHVGEVLGVEQVVDADDFDIAEILGRAKHHASDPAETVNTDSYSHITFSCKLIITLFLKDR